MAISEMKQVGNSNVYKVYVSHDDELDRVISQISKNGGKITSITIVPEEWQGNKAIDEKGFLVYIVM